MTTLYRPVQIESAEQAEALPEGTVVINTRAGAIDKGSRGRWWSGLTEVPERTAIGGAALVPIEAEEETRGGPIDDDWDWDDGPVSPPPPTPATRLVTPWETSAPSPDRRGGCA